MLRATCVPAPVALRARDAGALICALSISIGVAASNTPRTYSYLLSTCYRKQHTSATQEQQVALLLLLPT